MHYTNYLCIYIYTHIGDYKDPFWEIRSCAASQCQDLRVRRAAENAQADAWGCRRVDLGRINMLVKP